MIYLDTNHWINLRHVFLGSCQAQKEYADILLLLDKLATERRLLCPISFPLFLELVKQSDMRTRKATADLMQALSGGVCIQVPYCLEKLELRQRAMKGLLGSEATATWVKGRRLTMASILGLCLLCRYSQA